MRTASRAPARRAPQLAAPPRRAPPPGLVAQALTLQHVVGNRAVARLAAGRRRPILARTASLEWDPQESRWTVAGRASFVWGRRLTLSLVGEWNHTHPAEPIDPHDVKLTDEQLDRCHKLSWDDIRHDILVPFLNGKRAASVVVGDVRSLYGGEWDYDDEYSDEFEPLKSAAIDLVNAIVARIDGGGNPPRRDVMRLANLLNSARANLRLDAHEMNIRIQGHMDPSLVYTGKKNQAGEPTWRATPRTKRILRDRRPHYLYSPYGTGVASSSGGGDFFPLRAATPKTRKLLGDDDCY